MAHRAIMISPFGEQNAVPIYLRLAKPRVASTDEGVLRLRVPGSTNVLRQFHGSQDVVVSAASSPSVVGSQTETIAAAQGVRLNQLNRIQE